MSTGDPAAPAPGGEPGRQSRFEPVPPLRPGPGQITDASLAAMVRRWADSPPLRTLAEASGWAWPVARDTAGLVAALSELSADWDFRGRARRAERNFIGADPAEVNGRVVPEDLITEAADALGLVHGAPPPAEPVTHLVVLSGLVRACVNRTRRAADLLRDGLRAGTTVVLAGHRELGGDEPALARQLSLGADLFDEADAALAATRRSFGLGDPQWSKESVPRPPGWDESLRGAWAQHHWDGLDVWVVPSAEPGARRVNTADQLTYWAEQAHIGDADHVLLLTTQIYAPFQQLVALRLLGLRRGCDLTCLGVDAQTSVVTSPVRFSGRSYLQEIRSALLAAGALLTDAKRLAG